MIDNIGSFYAIDNVLYKADGGESKFDIEGAVYEVIRVIDGRLLFFDDHIDRLDSSLFYKGINIKIDRNKTARVILDLTKKNNLKSCNACLIYLPADGGLLTYNRKFFYPSPDYYTNGVSLSAINLERPDPMAKIQRRDIKNAASSKIKNTNTFEVLYIDNNGFVTEGSRTNFFLLKGSNVYTAPEDMVLCGITRKYVIQAIKELGLTLVEEAAAFDLLPGFDGMFISGTSINALPVSVLVRDGLPSLLYNTPDSSVFLRIKDKYENIMETNLKRIDY